MSGGRRLPEEDASSRWEDHADDVAMVRLSCRQILVGRLPARMHGLDELFDELFEQGRRPDAAGLGAELVERARAHSYIPTPAVDDFAQALRHEHRTYTERRAEGGSSSPSVTARGVATHANTSPGFPLCRRTYATGAVCASDSAHTVFWPPAAMIRSRRWNRSNAWWGAVRVLTYASPWRLPFPPAASSMALRQRGEIALDAVPVDLSASVT